MPPLSDREELLNNLTGNEPADDDTNTLPPTERETIGDGDHDVGGGETAGLAYPEKKDDQPDEAGALAGKGAVALLDSLTAGAEKKPEEGAASGTPTPDPAAAATPKTDEPKTLDEQEAEALEGIKSERGRERIKAVFAERREYETKARQYEADINEFREMVKSTGMKPDEFAQTLEYGRLINSGNEQDMHVALQMLDAQRNELAKRLGVELPGTDPLADFPDLKADVDNMAMTKERALEVAKYRRHEQSVQATKQAQQSQQQEMAQYQQTIGEASRTAEAYFDTRKHEADYPAKMKALHAHFSDPAKMQEFVATFEPRQWFAQFKFMYDNMSVAAPAPRAREPQPISARPSHAGTPAADPNASNASRIMSHLDSLGI